MTLNSNYDTKEQFIKDCLKMCRYMRKEYKRTTLFYNKFVSIGSEYWKFCFYVGENIETEAILYHGKKETVFPLTRWGDRYSRWDSELKVFLEREILKED